MPSGRLTDLISLLNTFGVGYDREDPIHDVVICQAELLLFIEGKLELDEHVFLFVHEA